MSREVPNDADEPPAPARRPGVREAGHGVRWKLVGSSAERILNFAALPLLLRLVDRQAWGLVALATVVYSLVGLLRDLGVSQEILRNPDTSSRFVSTCFWIRLTIGGALYLLLATFAYPVARISGHPEIVPVLLVMGTALFLDALPSIQQAVLIRDLRIRPAMQIRVVCVTAGVGVSLVMAYWSFDEWALVGGGLVATVASAALLWFACSWRPTFELDRLALGGIVRSGSHLTGAQVLGWFTENFAVFALGVAGMDKQTLGYFSRAFVVGKWPDSLLGSVVGGGLATSFFAKLQHDPPKLREALHRATGLMYLVGLPMGVVLIVLTEDFWSVVAGPRWSPAVTPCRIIAVGGTCLMLRQTLRHWLIAAGAPSILMRTQFVVAACSVALTLAGLWYGMVGVAVATSVSCLLEFGLLWSLSRSLTHAGLSEWLRLYWRPIACAAILAVALAATRWFLPQTADLTLRVLTEAFVGTTVWLSAAWLLCADDLLLLGRITIPNRVARDE